MKKIHSMAIYVLIAVIVIAALAVGCTFTGATEEPVSSYGADSDRRTDLVESDSNEESYVGDGWYIYLPVTGISGFVCQSVSVGDNRLDITVEFQYESIEDTCVIKSIDNAYATNAHGWQYAQREVTIETEQITFNTEKTKAVVPITYYASIGSGTIAYNDVVVIDLNVKESINNDKASATDSHDVSVQETDLPLYAEDWIDRITVPEGGNLGNFPVRRYDGNGWYIYIPVSGWNKVQVHELFADDQWRWESEYQTGSTLTVDHFTSSMEVLWADARKQGYTPLDNEKYIWEMSGNGMSGQYHFREAADGGCFRVSIQWTDANITDNPHIAMEPDVLRLVAESFTVDTE